MAVTHLYDEIHDSTACGLLGEQVPVWAGDRMTPGGSISCGKCVGSIEDGSAKDFCPSLHKEHATL